MGFSLSDNFVFPKIRTKLSAMKAKRNLTARRKNGLAKPRAVFEKRKLKPKILTRKQKRKKQKLKIRKNLKMRMPRR